MPLTVPFVGTNVLQTVYAEITSNQTTTSAAFVDLLTLNVNVAGNTNLLIWVGYSVSFSVYFARSAMLRLMVDGVEVLRSGAEEYQIGQAGGFVYRASGLAAGARTIALQWRIAIAGDGTLRCRTTNAGEDASIVAMEVSV